MQYYSVRKLKLRHRQDMDEAERLAGTIGERIRARRKAHGLTLGALAEATDLSQAFLSRLERGQVSASIANLLEIAAALDLPLEALFTAEPPAPAPRYEVFRAAEATPEHEIPATGYRWQPLAGGRRGQAMDAFVLSFPPDNTADVLVAHEGEELCFVLEGHVRFRVGGESVRLGPGDGIHLESTLPHMAENDGPGTARVLMVTAARGRGGEAFDWWNTPVDEESPRDRAGATTRRTTP